MPDASLAVQKALLARFAATPEVIALVPEDNIRDRNARPALDPSIIIGDDQVLPQGITIARDYVRVFSTVHAWRKETGMRGVKEIIGAIQLAIGVVRRLDLADDDFACTDCRVDGVRYIRDPAGEFAHGVITINCLVHQRWSTSA